MNSFFIFRQLILQHKNSAGKLCKLLFIIVSGVSCEVNHGIDDTMQKGNARTSKPLLEYFANAIVFFYLFGLCGIQ